MNHYNVHNKFGHEYMVQTTSEYLAIQMVQDHREVNGEYSVEWVEWVAEPKQFVQCIMRLDK